MDKTKRNRTWQSLNITWGTLASFVAFMSAVFGAGYTIGKTSMDIQRNEEIMQLNQMILNLRDEHYQEIESYSEKIHELRIKIYELQEKLLINK